MLSKHSKNNNSLGSGNENAPFFKPKLQTEQNTADPESEYGEQKPGADENVVSNKTATYSTEPIDFSGAAATGGSDTPVKEETSPIKEEETAPVQAAANVLPAKQEEATSGEEEINPEKQEHLRQEFGIYCEYKLEMIEKGEDVIPADRKKPLTKEEKKSEFQAMTQRFCNRMEGNRRSFWGTEKYERLLHKWFPDYSVVIAQKVSSVKNTINSSIAATNQNINEIIVRLKEALNVADTDKAKAMQLLEASGGYLLRAEEEKQKANTTLAEYGKDKSQDYMARYDGVLMRYQRLISGLTANIEGISQDKGRFGEIIGELSSQQSLLAGFSTKVAATSDVQLLIGLQKTEFSQLIAQADKTVEKVRNAGRNTAAVNEIETNTEIESGNQDLNTLGGQVEKIKQNEILRRQEEERKRREEEERKRKAEEARKKAEAERLKQEQAQKQQKTAPAKTPPSSVGKSNPVSQAPATTSTAGKSGDVVKSRGGADYSKDRWDPERAVKDSKSNIDESKISDKAFFEQYKKTCEAYLQEWYSKKGTTNKLTSDMYVNAAKRIYLKYKHLSYIVPAELAMVQGRLESGLGTAGSNPYKNPYNVGETDKGAKSWVKEMASPEMGIFFYMDLMAHDYLSKKTADQLLAEQGKSFVNEVGSRYASAPRYEMELKAMMGQVGLVRDKKRPAVSVGKNAEKNNGTASAAFVRSMLEKLGYKQANLGDAITAFQSKEMYPPLTTFQQKLVKGMNAGDKKSFDIKERSGVDGAVGPRGNTVGLLYYMTLMGSALPGPSVNKKETKIVTPNVNKVQELYKKYEKGNIDMLALGKALIPYCERYGADVIAVFDKLGWSTQDNLAYTLAKQATDDQLKHFDIKLLKRMKTILDPADNWSSVEVKTVQWKRVKKSLNEDQTVSNKTSTTASSTKQVPKQAPKEVRPAGKTVDFSLSDSVGAGARNKLKDVMKVQNFLISLNYLSSGNSEVKSVQQLYSKDAEGVIGESKIAETISAIKQYQKYGATTKGTLKKQDGKIDKNGYTHQSMIEMNQLNNNYKDEKFAQDIPNVLTKAQWRSQFRFGANFGDSQDAAEKEYVQFVKQETGLNDPADLHTAPKNKRDLVESKYKNKAKWFPQEILKTNGLKMNQKARPYKPNMVCCWDAANLMLGYTGATAKGENSKIQTFVAESGKGQFTNQAALGVKYIDAQLKMGKAVFVGVEKGKIRTINEGVTDHFILIVGKHTDGNRSYYNYFDPGTSQEKTAYDEKTNRLYIGSDKSTVQSEGSTYKLSQIRVNNE